MKTTYESVIQNLGFVLERKEEDYWLFLSKSENLVLFMDMDTMEKTVFFRGTTWDLEEIKLLERNKEDSIPPFGIASFQSPLSVLKAASICYGLIKSDIAISYCLPNKVFKSKVFNQDCIPLFDDQKFENLVLLDPGMNAFKLTGKSKIGFIKNTLGSPEKCLITLDPFSFLNFNKGESNAFIVLANPNASGEYLNGIFDNLKKDGFSNINYLIEDNLEGYISYLTFLTKMVNFKGKGDSYISIDDLDKYISFTLSYNSPKVNIKSVSFFNDLKSVLDNILESKLKTYAHQQRKILVLDFPYHQDLVIECSRKIREFFEIDTLPFVLEKQHV